MKPNSSFASMAYGFVGAGVFFVLTKAGPAVAQVAASIPYVRLQPTTPGTQELGHSNISGTARAGQFIGGGGGLTGVNADRLDGIDSTAFLQAVPNPLALTGSQSASSIITGTNTSTTTGSSGVRGVSSALSGTTYGLLGTATSVSGRGVFGQATSTTGLTYGGRFESDSTGGRGVYGFATATTGSAYGVFGQSNGDTGRGVYGFANSATGANYGGYFDSNSTNGYGLFATSAGTYGVYGESTLGSGIAYGGRFRTDSTAGVGVSGAALASTGNTFAGRFESNSTSGKGVLGWATASSGSTYGVWGKSDSPAGRGVFGDAAAGTAGHFQSASGLGLFCSTGGSGYAMEVQAPGASALHVVTTGFAQNVATIMVDGGYEGLRTTGTGTGVVGGGANEGVIGFDTGLGISGVGVIGFTSTDSGSGVVGGYSLGATDVIGVSGSSSDYRGVYGSVNNTGSGTSYGVFGESNGATGRGVLGQATSTAGVNYGVRGVNSNAAGFAVYAAGNFGVSGNKAFVIDHPLDPLNKYLKHYCAEGPEPKNIYDGTVVTDAKGWATVRLPDYFAAINKDPRVQLTVNDSSEDFVMVKTVGEVSGNTFRIRTSKGGVKVFWEVKATRNDLWNQAHGAPVEVLKGVAEKGKYQHPELYGQPREMAIDYDSRDAKAAQKLERQRAMTQAKIGQRGRN